MQKKKIIPVIVVLLVLLAVTYWQIERKKFTGSDVIKVSGNIEITDAEVSFRIPGRVEARLVSEGETVKAGQVVARMDRTDLEREKELGAAEVLLAESIADELGAGSRPEEIAQAAAVVKSAEADVERLRLDFARQKELHQRKVVSDREYEASRASYDAADGRLKEMTEKFRLVEKGPRSEKKDQAAASLQRARASLALIETRIGYADLESPLSGIVLSHHVEAGEYVLPGTPVITVGETGHTWLRAYINETDLERVKHGQKVNITTDAAAGKIYEGRVSFISSQAEFTPKTVQTAKERVKLVFRIKIDIPNPEMTLKPGMPADAEIITAVKGEVFRDSK